MSREDALSAIHRVRNHDAGLAIIAEQLIARYRTLEQIADAVKRHVVVAAVCAERGNQCAAAQSLGVHRNTVNRVMANL